LKEEERKLESLFEDYEKVVAPIHLELEVKQMEMMPYQKQIDDAQSKLDLSKNEQAIYLTNSKEAKIKYDQAIQSLSDTKKRTSEKKEKLEKTKKIIVDSKIELDEVESELQLISGKDMELMNHVYNLRQKADEMQEMLKSVRNQSSILSRLLQLKHQGRIPGIFGRLGDLGTIEDYEKYDVAISTACRRLDNIVVDTAETASICMNILREENLGRATFIILSKIDSFRDRAFTNIEVPSNSTRLYDLIKVEDERIKVAFYFSIQDTLVTQDLETATKIAFKKRKDIEL